MRSLVLLASLSLASTTFAQDGGALPTTLELLEEAEAVLTVPGIARIAIGDPSTADVKNIGNGQLLVTGGAAGKTTVVVWLEGGQRREIAVTVKAGEREAAEVEGLELDKGQLKSFKATGVTGVELGDPAVLEARLRGGRLQLRALAPGRCDVVLLRKAGPARLVVEVKGEDPVMRLSGVELKAGQSVTLMIEGAERATARHPALFEAKAPAQGRVNLRGLKAGRSTLELLVGGRTLTTPVDVVP
jgi:hypothetical protein